MENSNYSQYLALKISFVTVKFPEMDAYDIFMKLTRNAKFKHKNCKTVKDKQAPNCDSIEHKIRIERPIKIENSNANYSNDAIQLLGDISSSAITNKKSKRKSCKKDISIGQIELKKKHKALEELGQFRNKFSIKVVGSHVPSPISSFNQLPITKELISNLQVCGYNEPTAIQMQAIPVLLEGRQLLACAPTGSGKTIAFLIPIIHALQKPQIGCRALILCPTRELAKQTHTECLRLATCTELRIQLIRNTSKSSILKKKYKCDIIVSTPQRICHLLTLEKYAINMATVQWIIIDEADKLFEEYGDSGGRSFRSQLTLILDACTHTERRIAMFSATYTPLVAGWCRRESRKGFGGGVVRVMVGERNTAPKLVKQHLVYVGSESGKLLAFRELTRSGLEGVTLKPPVLVFVQSKERAQHLFNELIYDGINVDAIHADRTQQQRDSTVRAFREGKVWVLICTELMARGLDFKGINLVVNYDLPQSAVAYVHRVGRAGRAGRTGDAISFYTDADRVTPGLLRPIAAAIRRSGFPVMDHLLHESKIATSNIRRHLRASQVKRDAIPGKHPVNPKTLRKRKLKNTTTDSHEDDNELITANYDKKLKKVKQ